PLLARRDEPDPPAAMGRGLRLRPPARVRVRERIDRDGLAASRDPAGTAHVQRGCRGGPAPVRPPGPAPGADVPRPRGALAAMGRGCASVHSGSAGRLLDDSARGHLAGGGALNETGLRGVAKMLALVVLAFLTSPTAADAHMLQGERASFLVGLGHPVSGL